MSDLICRIKRSSSIYFAKPIVLKDGLDKEDISMNNITCKQDKKFNEVFIDSHKENVKRLDKWSLYHYDINEIPRDEIPYFLIDMKLPLYQMILDIIKERGYKFKKKNSLKRHIFLSLMDEGIPHEILKIAINYFFEKRDRSKNDRTKRFISKAYANLDLWNYSATFTYDSALLEADDFIKKLKTFLSNKASKRGWAYMGSFEKSPSGRDHFHCLIHVPAIDIPSLELEKEIYYNKQIGEMSEANISQSLKEKFGRVDFQEIDPYSPDFIYVIEYICKYIAKQENKIIYSKGIKDEFIGEIPNFEENCLGFLYPNSTFYMMDSKIGGIIKKL